MIYELSCPACLGDLFVVSDAYGLEARCTQCPWKESYHGYEELEAALQWHGLSRSPKLKATGSLGKAFTVGGRNWHRPFYSSSQRPLTP